MAKLNRFLGKIFGSASGPDQVSQFGSLFAGSPAFTTDPAIAQSLSNWLTGWLGAAIDGNSPAIEDMNSVLFVLSYQICYLMQAGVAEWETGTTYYTGSLARSTGGNTYLSLADDNTGNALTDTTKWKLISGDLMSTLGDILFGSTSGTPSRLAGNISTTTAVLAQTGNGSASAAPVWRQIKAPTIQKFTTGSGTYTKPTGVMWIRVRMVGGGSGGGGTGSTSPAGASGDNSTFGSSLLTANGSTGAVDGGSGGTATVNSPAVGLALQGAHGTGRGFVSSSSNVAGSPGASSPFGGAGSGGTYTAGGTAAVANTGSGGGGGGGTGSGISSGAGGGAGGYIDAIIDSPSATYAYAVGAGGAGGGNGGAGGSGLILVEEHYQ